MSERTINTKTLRKNLRETIASLFSDGPVVVTSSGRPVARLEAIGTEPPTIPRRGDLPYPLTEKIRDLFWSKVNKNGPTIQHMDTPCWTWSGNSGGGYGTMSIAGQNMRANRISWMLTHGPIPDGYVVRHICDNPPCVNPDHLLVGTKADNARDAVLRGRLTRPTETVLRGKKCPTAKLTEADVIAMRAEYAAGRSQYFLSRKYGVSGTAIGYALRGVTWADVPGAITTPLRLWR